MKSLFPLILIIPLLASCSSLVDLSEESLTSRIVQIETTSPSGSSGRGVIVGRGEALTSLHVVRSCQHASSLSGAMISPSEGCSLFEHGERRLIHSMSVPNGDQDVVYLSYSGAHEASQEHMTLQENPQIGQTVFALVSRSGSWKRLDGHILMLDSPYQAYSSYLVGVSLSGALVTDIVLEKGESGTPIWTLSGELIGVVSAVDRGGQKSYIVR